MSISYTGSITTGISAYTPADGITNTANNTALIVGNDNFLKVYNLTTLTFAASYTCLSSPQAICLIAPATATIVSNSVSTVDFIEINTGSRTNVSGGATCNNFTKQQQIASDPSQGIAFATCTTTSTLVKISSSQSVSTIKVPLNDSNSLFSTVILKTAGRWLCGTNSGEVIEIDVNGNIQDSFTLTYNNNNYNNILESGDAPTITNMTLDNNILLVSTNIALFLVDYSTKTIIQIVPMTGTSSTYPFSTCQGASGETVFARNYNAGTNQIISELDYTINPIQSRSELYTSGTNRVALVGLNSTNNTGWAFHISTALYVFNVTPRTSSLRTISVSNSSGVPQQSRLILIDDTGGVGNTSVLLDTYMQSPGTYRVPTGKTIKELVKIGNGATASWDLSSYST